MPAIPMRIEVSTTSLHIQQPLTGLAMLAARGLVRVDQRVDRARAGAFDHPAQFSAVVDDRVRLHFDLHDGSGVNEAALAEADLYFKRSCPVSGFPDLGPAAGKIRALGLNYPVFPDAVDRLALSRGLRLGSAYERVGATLRSLRLLDIATRRRRYTPRVGRLSPTLTHGEPAEAVFLARAWDPAEVPDLDGDAVLALNATRAECVTALRDSLGPRFHGGLARDAYSLANHPASVVSEPGASAKARYIDELRTYAVGIATTGLHSSIGWKFAEYVALSRAVVSEPLAHRVPGDFSEGHNYLAFQTPDECVERVERLLGNEEELRTMMARNALYYEDHLRPDAMMRRVLGIALDADTAGARPPRELR